MRRPLSLRTRWMLWRARTSMPALLARFDERRVVSRMTAVNGGLAILTLTLFAWLTDLPLVFPALGPSAFILFSAPLSAGGAPRSVVLGHVIAMVSGYAVWHLVSYAAGEPVSLGRCDWSLALSASLSLSATCFLLLRLSCPHPPACASSLVVALGGVTDWLDLLMMAAVVVWLTAQAVAMNRLARVPVPLWSPRDRGPV